MALLKLSSPWVEHYRKIEAMFKNDSDVKVIFNENDMEVRLYVDNRTSKANAIEELLVSPVEFGNVTLNITVIPANEATYKVDFKASKNPACTVLHEAFRGNTAWTGIEECKLGPSVFTYVMFKKEVVQYFNDSLNHPEGIHSTLYQEIAKDIFKSLDGVFYCTEIYEGLEPVVESCCHTAHKF